MKKELLGGLVLALLPTGCGDSGGSDKEKTDDGKETYEISIIQQMKHPTLNSARERLEKYLKGKSDAKFEIMVKNAQGDNGVAGMITKQFISEDVDLIYPIAINASQAAVNATGRTNILVVFNAVAGGVETRLITNNEKLSGNAISISNVAPLEGQLEMVRELLPEAEKIGMIYNIGEVNGKLQVRQVEELASKYNLKIVKKGVSATTEIATTTEQLAGGVDYIYNTTDSMVVSTTASITDKANIKNIPVFAAGDGQMKAGLLASDSISCEKLGEQAGSVAYNILVNGKKAGDVPVETAEDTTLYINKKVAEQLGIKIPDSLVERATLVEE